MIEHISTTRPKARKRHRCYLCGEAIEIGEVHVSEASKIDGDLIASRFHGECLAATKDWQDDDWETFWQGDLKRPAKAGG